MNNERAKTLLEKVGIKCEVEPEWIAEGQRPDFYCTGGAEFWCEVKTLEPPEDFVLLGDANVELRRRTSNISLTGQGRAYVSDSLTHRDAKVIVPLLNRALSRFNKTDTPKRAVALIPSDPNYGEFVRFSISTKDYQRWSHFLRQPVKVDSLMQRTIHHEDAETVFGRVQGQGRA